MAKKTMDRDLFETLRARGLRKRVARTVAQAAGDARDGKVPKVVRDTVSDLRALLDEIEAKTPGVSSSRSQTSARRSQAGRKAARTRQRNATRRSQAAKKGARTRARSS
jgi:hypothetical protein